MGAGRCRNVEQPAKYINKYLRVFTKESMPENPFRFSEFGVTV